MIAEKRAPWPRSVAVERRVPPPLDARAWAAITFVGHSTFLIQTRRGHILTDPMFSERASPLRFIGPRRVRRPAVAIADLPPIAADVRVGVDAAGHHDAAVEWGIRDRPWRWAIGRNDTAVFNEDVANLAVDPVLGL